MIFFLHFQEFNISFHLKYLHHGKYLPHSLHCRVCTLNIVFIPNFVFYLFITGTGAISEVGETVKLHSTFSQSFTTFFLFYKFMPEIRAFLLVMFHMDSYF